MSLPTSSEVKEIVVRICNEFENERNSLIPILQNVQKEFNYIPELAVQEIAEKIQSSAADINSVATFYSFLNTEPKGDVIIRLSEDMPAKMSGVDNIACILEDEFGIKFGETTADNKLSLLWTSCIGMSDQSPAMLVNDQVIPNLTPQLVKEIATQIKSGKPVVAGIPESVTNDLTFDTIESESGIKAVAEEAPAEIIEKLLASGLRGQGGAGFPTGLKLKYCAAAKGELKHIICNADEGEPGTFKDRVILTKYADKVLEGMTIAARAVGAKNGIIYLRVEYTYLKPLLEQKIQARRNAGLLGKNILGNKDFDFDIRIQLGAGAYVCGEETALIESLEGKRGEPRIRPPFPVLSGLNDQPTAVNNIETYAWISSIMARGAEWFSAVGTGNSKGYKLLSVSGDCDKPGVYEVEWGITVSALLDLVGAKDTKAVQVGGYSGQLVPVSDFSKTLAYEDIATGGSIIIYNNDRSIFDITKNYLEFFIEEGCGQCTPCKEGNKALLNGVETMHADSSDEGLDDLLGLCKTMQIASKCGLGQASPNIVLAATEHFRDEIVG